jgi:hypothetical protein
LDRLGILGMKFHYQGVIQMTIYQLAIAFIGFHAQTLEDMLEVNSGILVPDILMDHEGTAEWVWDAHMRPYLGAELVDFLKTCVDFGEFPPVALIKVRAETERAIISILTCLLARWRYKYRFGEAHISEGLAVFLQPEEAR